MIAYELIWRDENYTTHENKEQECKNFYEAVPKISLKKLAKFDQDGILVTSDYKFIDKGYVKIDNQKIRKMYKKWKKIKRTIPEIHNGLKVIIREIPAKEELKDKIIKYFEKHFTKLHKVYLGSDIIFTFRIKSKQRNIPNIFESFEKFFLEAYNLDPEKHELISCTQIGHEIEEKYPEIAKNHLIKINDIFVITKEGNELIKKEQEKNSKKIENEAKEFINDAKEFIKNELYEIKKDLKDKPFFHKISLISLKNEKLKKEVEKYIKILDNVFIVETKAGNFYAEKNKKNWNVKIPNNRKGLFIGKSGKNIKELNSKYNVRIKVN